ncbi:MAG TPA: HEAT repeat domain-containing protein [Kofleriaceae bacterium]
MRVRVVVVGWFVAIAVTLAHAEPPISELIKSLSDPSAEVRARAAQQLGYRTKEAGRLDPLEKAATSDPDPIVRLRALEGLSPQYRDIGTAARWKALRVKIMTKDADDKVRYEAVRQLRPAEKDTYAAHFAVLKTDKSPLVKTLVILSLQDTYAPGLVDAIAPMIDDKGVQNTVISTLGFSKDPRAVPILIDAVKRELPFAAGALANTSDPRAIEPILAVLDHTTNADRREEAIRAIVDVPDGRAVPRLLELWSKLSKADKKLSTRAQQEPMEDMSDLPHTISAALAAIAEVDQAPCVAAKSATGETKAYLKKILPAKCGGATGNAELEKLVTAQLSEGQADSVYTADATFSVAGTSDQPQLAREPFSKLIKGGSVTSRAIGTSGDGKSAWVALVANIKGVEWRVSELAVSGTGGWRIAGGLASVGVDNKAVNAAAKANKLKLAALPETKAADPDVTSAFTALMTSPLDATAAARGELIAFGSGPGERTTSGAVLARAWKGSWAKRLTVDGPVVTRLAPSGTTGYVIANIALAKPGSVAYKIPFRVLFVLDKLGGKWSVVHAHFATVAP